MAKSTPASKRFELPALDFNFQSLTEGTDIPPPPPSPIREVPTPPQTPPVKAKDGTANGDGAKGKASNGVAATTQDRNGMTIAAGTKRPADDTPLSPALSSRQGSIRRLFSRTLLNNSYLEGEAPANGNGSINGTRPASRSNGSILDEKKSKRSSGWFRRLRTSEPTASKRSSMLIEEPARKPSGPPPPMIPELKDLEQESSLGNDLFKNIK